jgi:regulator of replication initiation timing
MTKSTKTPDVAALNEEAARLKSENEELRRQLAAAQKAEASDEQTGAQSSLADSVATDRQTIQKVYEELRTVLESMEAEGLDMLHLTGVMRRRLQGAGERRWGIIDATHNMSHNDKQYFSPPFTSWEGLDLLTDNVVLWREVDEMGQRIARIARDHYLTTSNAAYISSRNYYRNLQTAARSGDTGAEIIYNDLRTYYERMGRHAPGEDDEITIDHLMKDAKALAHGRKDGKIVIEHESPHTTKGKHVVVDDAHKHSDAKFKATVSGTISCPHCNAENLENAKFCSSCGKEM